MLMKKILSLVTLLMLFVVAAWADTESSGNIGESNVTIIGNSYSLDGKYVAGKGSFKQGNMPDKGVKLRSNQGKLVFAVNAGYKISKFEFWGCGNTTTAVDIVSATVDGGNNLLSANVTLSAKGESTSGDIVLSDIEAVDGIKLTFAEGSNAQIVGTWKITYEQTEVITQEITAVTLNGVAISADNLATLKSTKELTIDGSNLNGIGVLGVTLSSGATTVTKTVDGTSFVYTFTINSTDNYTVTVTNVAKTYSQLGNVIAFSVNGENVEGANTNTVTSNGISFAMVDESKTFQYGMSKVTIGENVYVPLKLSTGSAVNVTFPDGMVATKVVVYGWSANGNGKLAAMKEKNEEDAKSVDVSNDVYFATNIAADIYPSVYTYELDNWESLYFNPGGSPSQPFVVMDFVLKKAAEPEPVADGPVVLWENGETSTLDGYTYITIPASQLKDVAKAKDTIRVSFAIANVEARQATPARNVRTGEISLWFGVDEIKTISEINKDTKSVDFILKTADVEKLAAAESVSLKYKYLTVAKVEFVSAVAVPEPEPVFATFDFSDPNIREHIGTAMTDVQGYIYNEIFTADGATLQITAGSAPSRIYVDSNRGQCLVTYKEYTTLTFRAPEGKAITKIEFVAAGNSNINNFVPSSGAITGMIWEGNAEGVRFLQGGTSYFANAIVTLVDKDNEETVALAAIDYAECANIAAFNALAAGSYAKVTLTDAEVTGISADGYATAWIQDATGGCWIQYSSLIGRLTEKTKVNGTVYVVKRDNSGNTQMKEAEATLESVIEATPIDNYTIVEGTIEQVNVAANLNKVVKIDGATLEETSATAGKLTQGEVSIDVNNGSATANQQLCKITNWAENTKLENIAMVAILVAKSASANQLLPISIETSTVGITNVSSQKVADVEIYNLQGVRMSQLQKGINIVNGKKVVIK